jgi:hypothetical protein
VRKRKTTYPPAKTANRPPPASGLPSDAPYVRPTVATIDLSAGKGKSGLAVGGRVRISGTGLYAGEIAVIERLVSGVIPQAVVRTEAGKTRQVRTIDLEPVAAGATSSAEPSTTAGSGTAGSGTAGSAGDALPAPAASTAAAKAPSAVPAATTAAPKTASTAPNPSTVSAGPAE